MVAFEDKANFDSHSSLVHCISLTFQPPPKIKVEILCMYQYVAINYIHKQETKESDLIKHNRI